MESVKFTDNHLSRLFVLLCRVNKLITLITHGYITVQINSVQNHLQYTIRFKNITREFNTITIFPIYLLSIITIWFIVLIFSLVFSLFLFILHKLLSLVLFYNPSKNY